MTNLCVHFCVMCNNNWGGVFYWKYEGAKSGKTWGAKSENVREGLWQPLFDFPTKIGTCHNKAAMWLHIQSCTLQNC